MEVQTHTTSDPPYVSPRGMWVTKLIFRVLQLIFDVTIMGMVGSVYNDGLWDGLVLACIMPVCGLSAVWATAEGICILARGGHRGIHPGANVALDLILWLAAAPCIAVPATYGIATNTELGWGVRTYYSSSRYYSYNLRDTASWGLAVIVMGAILGIMHFVTFVIACVECSWRNRQSKIIIVNPQPQPYPVPVTGFVTTQYIPATQQQYQQQYPQQYQPQYNTPQQPPQVYQPQSQYDVSPQPQELDHEGYVTKR